MSAQETAPNGENAKQSANENFVRLVFDPVMAPTMAKAFRIAAESGQFDRDDTRWITHWAEDMEAVGRD